MLPTPILLPQHPYPTAFQVIRLLVTFLTWDQHPLGSALPTTPRHQPPEWCRSTKPWQEQQAKLICIQSYPQVNPRASLSTKLCCLQRTGMLSKYTVTDLGTFPVPFTTPTSLWMINATADCICSGSPLSLLLS